MRITRTSDWREAIPFETPMIADAVMPGEAARCTTCGVGSTPLPRTELWAVKHRHPHDPAGTVRLYCAVHVPKTAQKPEPVASGPARKGARTSASRTPRTPKPTVPERVAAVCPDCFVEVPPTGVCGMCGRRVD
ncbi:hypothetical protein [Microbacterium luticocti]|uniref:hypothetical protein n=1 Tax=Microbacterium luticocti TaxID=451764 RepID=UPI000490B2E2|nr:hypothetical protein [Microbacterium luticocti]